MIKPVLFPSLRPFCLHSVTAHLSAQTMSSRGGAGRGGGGRGVLPISKLGALGTGGGRDGPVSRLPPRAARSRSCADLGVR